MVQRLFGLRRHPVMILASMLGLLYVAGYQASLPAQPIAAATSKATGVKAAHTTAAHTSPAKSTTPAASTTKPTSPSSSASQPATPAASTKSPTPKAAAAAVPATPATVSDIASEAVCPGQSNVAAAKTVLTCMTAYARTQHGLGAVGANAALMNAADAKGQDMATCGYAHEACGRPFNYWFAPKGYTGRCQAENIAQGYATPGSVFVAWMNSAGHRTNILNPSYRDIGINVIDTGNPTIRLLWTMELGGC